jgi:4-diphosphocytidyl-2-C-methyl-D-erythritol kinase
MDTAQALPAGALGVRAFAKVNLHLEVLRRRHDGYHEIESVMQSVGLYDTLHLVPRPRGLSLLSDSSEVPSGEENLCLRAARALLQAAGLDAPPRGVRIDLYKSIPVAAGFGGGSADAAATLVGMNRMWELGLDEAALAAVAARLGSDVAFCLQGGTALARGRGERLSALPALPPTWFLLLFAAIPVRAEWAYSNLNMGLTRRSHALSMDQLKSILARYPGAARGFFNRLENAVCPAHPLLSEITSRLLQGGAPVAMMSGSGGGVFAAFRNREDAERARRDLRRSDWRIPIVPSVQTGVELFTSRSRSEPQVP